MSTTPQPDSPAPTQIDDGGPAFPTHDVDDMRGYGGHRTFVPVGGMSLRDYFAAALLPHVWSFTTPPCAQVAAAIVENCKGDVSKLEQIALSVMDGSFNQQTNRMIARECYQMADAMLAARKGGVS